MDKLRADDIIENYIKPIFGFSLNRTRKTDEAEELANRIVIRVYQSLLRKDDIGNLDSYIFKVAHNVWADYVKESVAGSRIIEINSVNTPLFCEKEVEASVTDEEDKELLRREIAYLSKTQRAIILLHYFEDMKVNDISAKLKLPVGTVKWHLSEARKDLKEGMIKVRKVGNLGLNPIKFSSMGHSGSPGKLGDTSYFLSRTIAQNIVYAAYHEPKTVHEIAEELGVSPVFVEDEVSVLEEYGFMEKRSSNRYITNIYIDEISDETEVRKHTLFERYAAIIGEHYCSAIFDIKEKLDITGLYYPDSDFNFLLWSLIPYAIKEKLYSIEKQKISYEEVMTARKDGGNYTAAASINSTKSMHFDNKFYNYCGDMNRWNSTFNTFAWQLNTYWCQRGDWREFANRDLDLCHKFYKGLLPKDEINIEDYKYLIDKGYIIRDGEGYKLNIVWIDSKEVYEKLINTLPEPSEECIRLIKGFDKESYEIFSLNKPPQVDKITRAYTQNMAASTPLRVYVLKYLVDKGLLKEPQEHQKKTITTIMGIK